MSSLDKSKLELIYVFIDFREKDKMTVRNVRTRMD